MRKALTAILALVLTGCALSAQTIEWEIGWSAEVTTTKTFHGPNEWKRAISLQVDVWYERKCYASLILQVDNIEVMRQSCDFQKVWYAPTWDAQRANKAIAQMLVFTFPSSETHLQAKKKAPAYYELQGKHLAPLRDTVEKVGPVFVLQAQSIANGVTQTVQGIKEGHK
jgi:hypothetical protein